MRRRRSVLNWIKLGLAIAAVGGAVTLGKQRLEEQILSSVLGPGAKADAFQWHWTKAAGCAQRVEIPLSPARPGEMASTSLRADKLWFTWDTPALARKRLLLPKVVIQDAVLSDETNHVINVSMAAPARESRDPASAAHSGEVVRAQQPVEFVAGKREAWLDRIHQLGDQLVSQRFLNGRQVAVDAEMLGERLQNYFESLRQQAQRLVCEARDIRQQLTTMNNVLRHEAQLLERRRRMEELELGLVNLKRELGRSSKSLDEEHAQLRSGLLAEQDALQAEAQAFDPAGAQRLAAEVLSAALHKRLHAPTRSLVIVAELVRKPLDYQHVARGANLRLSPSQLPQFACAATSMSGLLEIAEQTYPMNAKGNFSSGAPMANGSSPDDASVRSSWTMEVDDSGSVWHLEGRWQMDPGGAERSPATDDGSGIVKVRLECRSDDQLQLAGTITNSSIDVEGSLCSEAWFENPEQLRLCREVALGYAASGWLEPMVATALQCDSTPLDCIGIRCTGPVQESTWEADRAVVDCFARQLECSAGSRMAQRYETASQSLTELVARKQTEHRQMVATLRRDAEQYLSDQLDEVRKLQAAVNTFIEQHSGGHFARQPGSDLNR